jgi:CRISPR-associated protein Cas5t
MRVLKIVAEGLTTSFRYPHLMQQIHPTFEMPPPATIYGHIVSALGDWFDPTGVKFAYHFTVAGKVTDVEHIMVLSSSTGKLKGTGEPKVLEGNINPFEREMLFRPKLTLYLNQPEWEAAFRSPRYAVVLGRSQDLFTYTDVRVVDLPQQPQAYFEHTLLPYTATQRTLRGYAVLMPRYLDHTNHRQPNFAQYFVVKDRVHTGDAERGFFWLGERPALNFWVDPETPEHNSAQRGLAFHSFNRGDDDLFAIE